MKKLAILLLVLLILSQLLLPAAAERGFARAMDNTFSAQGETSLEISAFPAVKLLFGYLDEAVFSAAGFSAGGVELDAFEMNIENAKIDLRRMIFEKKIVFDSIGDGSAFLSIGENRLNTYLSRSLSGYLTDPEVEIVDGGVEVKGSVRLLGREVPVQIQGEISPSGHGSLVFAPKKVKMGDYELPEEVRNRLISNARISFSPVSLPFEGRISSAEFENEKLVVVIEK